MRHDTRHVGEIRLTESLLFTPIQLRDVRLKNRIVVAPMRSEEHTSELQSLV